MKYLFVIAIFALSGCVDHKALQESCYRGAITAITAIKEAGAELPSNADRSLISLKLETTCNAE